MVSWQYKLENFLLYNIFYTADNQLYLNFDEYIRQGEPGMKERADAWRVAIGLQAVDGLTTSDYLKETARKNIEGEITIDEARERIRNYYITKTVHDKDYAEDYHLLRAHDHSDVIKYPIGSVWRCNEESGLNNPETDTVTIVDYALSQGMFWVHNTEKPTLLFIAYARGLQPVKNKQPVTTI